MKVSEVKIIPSQETKNQEVQKEEVHAVHISINKKESDNENNGNHDTHHSAPEISVN